MDDDERSIPDKSRFLPRSGAGPVRSGRYDPAIQRSRQMRFEILTLQRGIYSRNTMSLTAGPGSGRYRNSASKPVQYGNTGRFPARAMRSACAGASIEYVKKSIICLVCFTHCVNKISIYSS